MADAVAAAREVVNVVIRAGDCIVTLLPQFGGKVSSIQIRGKELMQAPLRAITPRTQTMGFEAADASGWDECFPSVAPCEVQGAFGRAQVPDHGDLWRVAWERVDSDTSEQSITLRGKCFSLPLEMERSLELQETGKGWRLSAHYTVRNCGKTEVPWSWAAHPLFAAEAGDQILLPGTITQLLLEGSGGNRLGPHGSVVQWPVALLSNGTHADLSMVQPPETQIGDKLFAGPVQKEEAWCTLLRPSAGLRIKVHFDAEATPYLGLWICYGGWPDGPGPKQKCVALEPATAPHDSLATEGPWSRMLQPDETSSWPMLIDFELL
ncbi:MAG: hypothetical protein KGN79_15375 [Acidobacteriota bacterium]|nr:hypothetical protein [Acidobacteriota bacterium]